MSWNEITPEQALGGGWREVPPPQPPPQYNPAEGMNALQRGLVGAGASAARAGEGILGAAGSVLPMARRKAEEMARDREIYEANKSHLGTAGTVGEIAGIAGTTAPLIAAGPAILPQMALGAAYGGLTTPGDLSDRAVAAGVDAAGAGAGGVLLNALGTVGSKLAPKRSPEIALLEKHGVEPTLGQIMQTTAPDTGGRGILRRSIARMEEGLQSVPFAGNTIRGSRERAAEQWREAARRQALPPGADASAAQSMESMRVAFNNAYSDALQGLSINPSVFQSPDAYAQAARRGLAVSDEQVDTAAKFLQSELGRFGGKPTAAFEAQKLQSDLMEKALGFASSGNPADREWGQLLRGMADALGADWRGALPWQSRAQLGLIDNAYREFVPHRVAAKSGSAGRVPDEYSPNQLLTALRQGDPAKKYKTTFVEGRAPGQEFASAGQRAFRTTVPDSGTPERTAMMSLPQATGALITGGAGLAMPVETAMGMAATGIYGTRPVQNWLTGRSSPLQSEALRKVVGVGGLTAAEYNPLVEALRGQR